VNRSLWVSIVSAASFALTPLPLGSNDLALAQPVVDFNESALRVCQDESGNLRTGDLDVIVLLDNSKSLWGSVKPEGEKGSDRLGVRFEAIDRFVDSFQKIDDREKNFSLITFGASAEVVIPFEKVSTLDDAKEIKETLRQSVPNEYESQESFTNHVAALETAREEFLSNDSGNRNCRILIWFTDGVFDTNDSDQPEGVKRDVRRLEGAVCASDGLGKQYAESDINTFVVYLTPQNPNPDRSRISQDAMQVVTGDREPSFSSGSSNPRTPSPGCVIGSRHLGEVISVEDTSSLLGYLTDLVPTADSATPILPEECPIQVTNLNSLPLIDGHLVDWISVTTWGVSLDVQRFSIDLVDGNSQPLTDLFEAEMKDDRLYYFRPTDQARDLLDAGWTLSLKDAGEVCVRLKPRSLQFEIGRDNATKSLNGIPEELFGDGRLKLFVDGRPADVKSALRNPGGLTAQLEVDSGDFLSPANRLAVFITVNGAFQITPPRCAIKVKAQGDVPTAPIESSSCLVTPAASEDTSYDASALLAGLDECGVGPWQLLLDGAPADSRGELTADGAPVVLSAATVNDPENKEITCEKSLGTAVAISTRVASSEIVAELQLKLYKRGNALLAILFAVVMTLLVAFLSLVLLKGISFLTAKTIDGSSFFAYETEAEVEPDKSERGALRWPDTGQTPKEYKANPDLLEPVKTDKSRTSLSAGELRFERRIPSFFRPFSESRLKMVTPTSAVFWQSNRERDGLPLTFAKAIVLSRVGKENLSQRRNMKVRVTALVPRRGFGSGFGGAEELIREKADQLAADLWEASSVAKTNTGRQNTSVLPTSSEAAQSDVRIEDSAPPVKPAGAEAPKPPLTPPTRALPSEPPKFPK
jgi:hypothetical protein